MTPRRILLVMLALVAACDGSPEPGPSASSPPTASRSPSADPAIAAAGDIVCAPRTAQSSRNKARLCGDKLTAGLIAKGHYDAVLALGDLQYEAGSLSDYRRAYAKSWGRFRSITYPVPGNHEYGTARASGYFAYFGSRAHPATGGYYSFDIGTWHVIALNSNCGAVGGCGAGSPQGRWLRNDLATHHNTCTLAYWHHPRFSSGLHGSDNSMVGFWRLLYAAGADVVLSGHDHDYERFAPQTPDARADARRGITQFVVGTGGRSRYPILRVRPNSAARYTAAFGVLALTLRPSSFAWRFVPAVGTFSDSGSGACH
jgi:hypothetical protein